MVGLETGQVWCMTLGKRLGSNRCIGPGAAASIDKSCGVLFNNVGVMTVRAHGAQVLADYFAQDAGCLVKYRMV